MTVLGQSIPTFSTENYWLLLVIRGRNLTKYVFEQFSHHRRKILRHGCQSSTTGLSVPVVVVKKGVIISKIIVVIIIVTDRNVGLTSALYLCCSCLFALQILLCHKLLLQDSSFFFIFADISSENCFHRNRNSSTCLLTNPGEVFYILMVKVSINSHTIKLCIFQLNQLKP